jgi:Cu/Ag efflux protein CusF
MPPRKKVRLDHEDIPGYMKAMEMDFNVDDASALEGLKSGDKVHGILKVKPGGDLVITQLRKQ